MTTFRFEPTERQAAVLRFVADAIAANGYPPTLGDIADALGFAGKTGSVCHVRALRSKGAIVWAEGRQRTIRPTEFGLAWLESHCVACRGNRRPAGRRPSVPAGRRSRHGRVTVRRDGVKRKARTGAV